MYAPLHSMQQLILCVIITCSETEVQLRIFCETESLGEVMLDNLKERWNVNDEQQGCQKRTLRYATVKWELLMDTWWLRFDRYELNQSSTFPCMPTSLRSHSNKILRSTVSNAALRSNRTIRVTCCLFIFKRMSFITLRKVVSVLWCWW